MPRTPTSALALTAALSAALLGALLTGCSLGDGAVDTGASGTPASAEEARISVPSLGVSSPLLRLVRDGDGGVRVPPAEKRTIAGWYTDSAEPGKRGAAVIVGHGDPATARPSSTTWTSSSRAPPSTWSGATARCSTSP
ncbi:hypothetical protein ACFQ2B_22215 [Streptomyces stramineus]